MMCDSCKERDAVVHLTTIENNAVHQLHLCERCAAERGVKTTVATPKHPLGEFLQAVHQQVATGTGSTSGDGRSEERRVGKAGRSRREPGEEKKTNENSE